MILSCSLRCTSRKRAWASLLTIITYGGSKRTNLLPCRMATVRCGIVIYPLFNRRKIEPVRIGTGRAATPYIECGSGMDARSFDNGRMVDPASSGRAPNLGPQGPPCCDGIRDQELLPDILGIWAVQDTSKTVDWRKTYAISRGASSVCTE